jgi:L-serine dehydratase
MRAAFSFGLGLAADGTLETTARVRAELYGSLALTGWGHATDRAVLLGLAGNEPASIDPERIEQTVGEIRARKRLTLAGRREIVFDEACDLLFRKDQMFPPQAERKHPNGMRLTALDTAGAPLCVRTYFSVGGGFVVEDGAAASSAAAVAVPFPFQSAAQLLELGARHELTVAQLMLENECALHRAAAAAAGQTPLEWVRAGVVRLWETMRRSVERGCVAEGLLPGGLNVRRRAASLVARIEEKEATGLRADPLAPLDWLTVYAIAVNEENAAGGQIVTAPTNGAAGVVPAVAHYYARYAPEPDDEGILRFFLASAAIGILYKENASISGAEVGCQGEVGVACSMAAAGLTAAMGGSNEQVEHAAEVAMEHNLGMTCDPIAGLVQIPCIERNAMGAVKAVEASRIALAEEGRHRVSLDQVIRTMYLTGLDMQSRYKETSLAGLALNRIEC